jgi:hypothetical protein
LIGALERAAIKRSGEVVLKLLVSLSGVKSNCPEVYQLTVEALISSIADHIPFSGKVGIGPGRRIEGL